MRHPNDSDEQHLLRLPPPPRAAQVELDGSSHGEVPAGTAPEGMHQQAPSPKVALVHAINLGAEDPPAVPTDAGTTPTDRLTEQHLRRPSLEVLLHRAESLAHSLSISDPKGRLLQVALLRRDHTLLEAIVKTVDGSLPTHRPAIGRATNRAATIRPGRNSQVRRRPHAEHPIPAPRRARQS